MAERFAGRVALVTGGGSGIGAACCRMFAAAGASVVVADRDAASAAAVAAELTGPAEAVQVDVRDPAAVEAVVGRVVERFGALDVAVNNAGISGSGTPIHEIDREVWERIRSVNYDGVFHCLQSELRVMVPRGSGAIVNVASVMGAVSGRGSAAYVASKHGVVGLTRAAAMDVADTGVRVNAVGPGYIDTPLLSAATRDRLDAVVADHPVGRLGTPEEIASVVGFLASADASFVTGALYLADGGYTTH
ncbi:SDR family NAD(P)-dependent oxidoreductase [Pseudonocardia halophobica]|nr:SDR family NAD(P)-dependent oxidoreductase [Pseudonocardia halophobica]